MKTSVPDAIEADALKFLADRGVTPLDLGLPVVSKYDDENADLQCEACHRSLRSQAGGFNTTVFTNLPGEPLLCARCVMAFVRHGVFQFGSAVAEATQTAAPVVINDEGQMSAGNVTFSWG